MLGHGFSITRPAFRKTTQSPATVQVQPIVMVGASNTAGGDDSAGAALDAGLDGDPNIHWLYPADGTIGTVDVTTGIPRPGGLITDSTSPVINFTKFLRTQDPSKIYVVVPTAVGGRGVHNGGDVAGSGPWDPDGTGAAWGIGDLATGTEISGALYKAHTSGNWKTALEAAVASGFPGHSLLDPIFFGHPCNENDTLGSWSVLADKAKRCIEGIRSAWEATSAPWVLYGGPPEWTYQGPPARAKITSVNAYLDQIMPGVVYVEGQEGYQHATEAVHYNNAGYRLLGTKLGPAVAVAETQTSAPHAWVDWIDTLANKPQRAYGLYRFQSTYAGAAFRLHNGTTEVDIGFDTQGYPDLAAIEAHVGGGNAYITAIYDQMGSGSTMIPEGTDTAELVNGGEIHLQNKRVAWGNDTRNILMKDESYTALATGALLAVGTMSEGGNPTLLAGDQNVLGIFAKNGDLHYGIGTGDEFQTGTLFEQEPSWLSGSGYSLNAIYVDSNGVYLNGLAQPTGTATGWTYSNGGLAWAGRIGYTNRYAIGSHVAAFAWDVAPVGTDMAVVQDWARAMARVDILDL